jgi:ABC-type dipeptide/oligopeptide/nickel transport system ATPase component
MNPQWNPRPRTMILVTHDIQFILIIIKFSLAHKISLNFKYLSHGNLVEDVVLQDIYKNKSHVWDLLKNDINGDLLKMING